MAEVRYPVDPVTLRLAGVDWTFWKSCEISVQVDAVAGSFSIGAADPWSAGAQVLPIAAGMECEVLIGDARVLTGYIDKVSPSFSASDHAISITGRSKSADLVDCSAVHKPGHWRGLTALELASVLAEPFGVSVIAMSDVGAPFPSFKLEQGETAFEALDRCLKQRELLACSYGNGGILLVRVGAWSSSTALVQGENILQASANYDMTDRFSEYLVQGQQPGNDKVYGEAAANVHAKTRDESVARYRPFILRSESAGDVAAARQRAAWERTVRAARSVTVSVTVQGFRMRDGGLWTENSLTEVDIPYLQIQQELLISQVTYRRDAQGGSTTVMELKDPKSFQPEPKTASGGSGSSGPKEYRIEAEKDLQTQAAENSAQAQSQIKEGAR
jgi:prophage tail gpP-like protein